MLGPLPPQQGTSSLALQGHRLDMAGQERDNAYGSQKPATAGTRAQNQPPRAGNISLAHSLASRRLTCLPQPHSLPIK